MEHRRRGLAQRVRRRRPKVFLRPWIVETLNTHGCQSPRQLLRRFNRAPLEHLPTTNLAEISAHLRTMTVTGRIQMVEYGVYGPFSTTLVQRVSADKPRFAFLRHLLKNVPDLRRGGEVATNRLPYYDKTPASWLSYIRDLVDDGLLTRRGKYIGLAPAVYRDPEAFMKPGAADRTLFDVQLKQHNEARQREREAFLFAE
jgi:hypothetical protein